MGQKCCYPESRVKQEKAKSRVGNTIQNGSEHGIVERSRYWEL